MKTKILPLRLVVALASVCLFALALCFDAAPRGQTKDSAHSAQHTALPAARRALVVSLDGLDARYLLRADEYGLKIPTLRRLMAEGLRAEGVIGVYPSVTYPSHTTIVTGARPARHGVYANELFEPPPMWQLRRWYWSASYVRAETLWDAAARAGLKTGVVSWPVSTGAGDWSVPEIWKVGTNPYEALEATLAEISANARPRGIVEEIAARDKSVYANGTNDERDDMRTRWAEYVIAEKRPHMVLVHLFDLDHFQHKWGPFTPEAFGALEKSDAYVARLLAAHERAGTLRETAVFVVSDHGFLPITKQINPNVLLARAGLIKLSEERDARGGAREVITEWRALAHPASGACAVVLRDPQDKDALDKALAALKEFSAREDSSAGEGSRPRSGEPIFRIVGAAELKKLGAHGQAAFYLEAAAGYAFGRDLTGEPVTPHKDRGTHGYMPTRPNYRASFVASGRGVARRGSLGTINMTDIGPTVAHSLGLKLRDAEGRALRLH